MTVAELIEALSKLDPELEVVVKVSGGVCNIRWVSDEPEDDGEGYDCAMVGIDC